jgi:hypothetical protein
MRHPWALLPPLGGSLLLKPFATVALVEEPEEGRIPLWAVLAL